MTARLLLMLTLPPLLWAGNAIIGKVAAASMAPFLLNTLRWTVALAALLPFALRRLSADRASIRKHWRYIAISGFWGVTSYNALQYLALHTSSPINVSVLTASAPVFVLLVGRIAYGEHIHRLSALGALLSLAGILWVIARGDLANLGALRFTPGDLFMVAAVLIWSQYTWMLRRKPAELSTPTLLAAQIIAGLLLSLPLAALEPLWFSLPADAPAWGWRELAIVLYVGLLPSLVAMFCWQYAVAHTSAQLPVFFINLMPLFAVLMSALLLGEYPHLFHAVGLALVLGGIFLAQAGKRPQ